MARITKVDQKNFKEILKNAQQEKDVEAAYRNIFGKYYGGTFITKHHSDGYLAPDEDNLLATQSTALRLLLEVKWRKNLQENDRIKIIAQTIYYLKAFQKSADPLPNVIVGGDENEMFVFYAPKLYKYLDKDYDWSLAPSSAYENEQLYRDLLEDENVKDVYVFQINGSFDINEVFEAINALRDLGEFKKLKVDEANLRKTFDEFVRLVFGGDQWLAGVKKIGAHEAVSIFIQSILGNADTYIHPNKPNVLVTGKKEIRIKGSAYNAFFSRYDRDYSAQEIDQITAIADQLIKEIERRFHGDFWTPTIWADRAIKMITDDLGPDWREKYVVWDPAAGTKNLTRDYEFKKLFTSTLHQSEIDMGAQYNKNAVSFQYDFLNDDIDVGPASDPRDLKMPRELFEALKNDEPIVFYTNPPYGQASNQNTNNKKGIAENEIGKIMQTNKFGHASSELYTQFIYRVQKIARDFHLSNVFFFFFNKGFLTSPAFEKFTDQLLDQFKFNDGFMLNAGEFQGTASSWGIIFSNFENKKDGSPRQEKFTFSVEKSSSNNNGTEKITEHTMSRVNKNSAITTWLNEIDIQRDDSHKEIKRPKINGGLNLPAAKMHKPIETYNDFLGFLEFHGYGVQNSDKYVHLNSTSSNDFGHGYSVYPDNFERICATFAIRKSILPDFSWINDKDVFRRPSDEFQASKAWPEFAKDCVVFSLFHRSSYQTSLRDFEYNGELYDVKNEWFFMPKSEIIALAEKHDLKDIVFDAKSDSERFVYNYLHTDTGRTVQLSPEAKALLSAGEDFIRACFAKRFLVSQDHPEWHLMTWDAGYYQSYKIYTALKPSASVDPSTLDSATRKIIDAYTKLDSARTRLETKIRSRVYADHILEK